VASTEVNTLPTNFLREEKGAGYADWAMWPCKPKAGACAQPGLVAAQTGREAAASRARREEGVGHGVAREGKRGGLSPRAILHTRIPFLFFSQK